jgi:hypothetical protein
MLDLLFRVESIWQELDAKPVGRRWRPALRTVLRMTLSDRGIFGHSVSSSIAAT